jgi:hypothetical protein
MRALKVQTMSPPHELDSAQSMTFVLSLWRASTGGPWRAALRPADGGRRLGFADIEQLAAFLLRMEETAWMTGDAPTHQTTLFDDPGKE